ncbi:hypothetical protein AUC71_09430 [Methyloceanibacter marginalis]|uniref:SH3b domain-containing protein n=1 Tax=Methyloceanibacter marginalis TaxID=1774971 RepID=A0A1E3WCD2_9HYPH|nr:DUF6600 domain-containing protein [Methyloceanibacter marginalis]ODS03483.1 hypothetical protein AUC71_09430 [Methyloceanibacter marginalis]
MSSLRIFVSCLILGAGFATSAAAQEPNGYPITDVNLRAGPGTEYPVILTVPADAPITILGCLPDYSWCDSVFENYRGWMSAVYLSGYSEGDYYLLRDYAPDLGYQRVTFNIDAYWDSYYRDEPFYGNRGRWARPREAGWVDDGVFYDRLSPHGSWTWIQGRYVWVPANVDRGWRPYTRGRWVYTDRGWTWASNEPFGWATYHYGRWGFSDRVGWFCARQSVGAGLGVMAAVGRLSGLGPAAASSTVAMTAVTIATAAGSTSISRSAMCPTITGRWCRRATSSPTICRATT